MLFTCYSFVQGHGSVIQLTGIVKGLKPGNHGFHIHEYGDMTVGL